MLINLLILMLIYCRPTSATISLSVVDFVTKIEKNVFKRPTTIFILLWRFHIRSLPKKMSGKTLLRNQPLTEWLSVPMFLVLQNCLANNQQSKPSYFLFSPIDRGPEKMQFPNGSQEMVLVIFRDVQICLLSDDLFHQIQFFHWLLNLRNCSIFLSKIIVLLTFAGGCHWWW